MKCVSHALIEGVGIVSSKVDGLKLKGFNKFCRVSKVKEARLLNALRKTCVGSGGSVDRTKGWLTPGILLRPVYFSFCQLEVSLACPRQAPFDLPSRNKMNFLLVLLFFRLCHFSSWSLSIELTSKLFLLISKILKFNKIKAFANNLTR